MKITSIKPHPHTSPAWLITTDEGKVHGATSGSMFRDIRLIAALCARDAEARAIILDWMGSQDPYGIIARARAWLGETADVSGQGGVPS